MRAAIGVGRGRGLGRSLHPGVAWSGAIVGWLGPCPCPCYDLVVLVGRAVATTDLTAAQPRTATLPTIATAAAASRRHSRLAGGAASSGVAARPVEVIGPAGVDWVVDPCTSLTRALLPVEGLAVPERLARGCLLADWLLFWR